MKMRNYLFIILVFSYSISFSQVISGKVLDKKTNEPLIGVNIILSNINGTTTDLNGKFEISLKDQEKIITFKYIGYKTISKVLSDIDDLRSLEILMKSDVQQYSLGTNNLYTFSLNLEEAQA